MSQKVKACGAWLSIVLIAVFGLLSCAAPVSADTLDTELLASPAVREVVATARDIAYRVSMVFDRDALVEAISAHDGARAAELLGFTEAEANALNARMDELRVEIFLAFPDVERMSVGYAGSSCGFAVAGSQCDVRSAVDNAAEAVSALDELLGFMDAPQGSNRPVSCHWGPYTASLVLCTTLGPVLYWPCAYVALCSFCEGGWVDSACS